jgi:hypothetical protein
MRTDGDGVNDGQEALDGTDPLNPDTDGDGVVMELKLLTVRTLGTAVMLLKRCFSIIKLFYQRL